MYKKKYLLLILLKFRIITQVSFCSNEYTDLSCCPHHITFKLSILPTIVFFIFPCLPIGVLHGKKTYYFIHILEIPYKVRTMTVVFESSLWLL